MILIIEREENSSSEIRHWALQHTSAPVFVANAVEALLWLGKGNLPRLILAEAAMQPIAGPEFVRTLKSSGFFQDIPVVVFGNPEQHPLMAEMRQAGASDHVFLPVNVDFLQKRFDSYLLSEVGL
jgi:CheY-like chemotaxis protein